MVRQVDSALRNVPLFSSCLFEDVTPASILWLLYATLNQTLAPAYPLTAVLISLKILACSREGAEGGNNI